MLLICGLQPIQVDMDSPMCNSQLANSYTMLQKALLGANAQHMDALVVSNGSNPSSATNSGPIPPALLRGLAQSLATFGSAAGYADPEPEVSQQFISKFAP